MSCGAGTPNPITTEGKIVKKVGELLGADGPSGCAAVEDGKQFQLTVGRCTIQRVNDQSALAVARECTVGASAVLKPVLREQYVKWLKAEQ